MTNYKCNTACTIDHQQWLTEHRHYQTPQGWWIIYKAKKQDIEGGREGARKNQKERNRQKKWERERESEAARVNCCPPPPLPFLSWTLCITCVYMCVCVIIFTHSKDYTRSFLKTWHIINSVTAMAIGLSETTPPLAQISIVLYCETI